MPPINRLPPELVIGVTDHFDDICDIAALVLTSRKFYATCNQTLYRKVIQIPGSEAVPLGYGAFDRNLGTVEKALAAGTNPNHVFATLGYFPTLDPLKRKIPITEPGDTRTHGDGDESGSENDPDSESDEDHSESGRSDDYMERKYTALHIAVYRGALAIVETLLNHGADINIVATNYCGCYRPPPQSNLMSWYWERTHSPISFVPRVIETPIHIAICGYNLAISDVLIKRGADLLSKRPQRPASGSSAMFLAARLGYVEFLRAMFESNSTSWRNLLDAADSESLTPLYHACASGRWHSTVPFLLKHGASLDKRIVIDHENFRIGSTMLGEACYTGNFSRVVRLLDLGAGISQGVTVVLRVPDLVDIPRWNHGSNEALPLLHACCHKPKGLELASLPLAITRLVTAGASLQKRWGSDNMTALHFAARSNIKPAVHTLLQLGSEVNACDHSGKTPLMLAILENVRERYMRLRWDVDPRERRYPSILPMDSRGSDVLPVLGCLMEFGASVHNRDSNGKTALHHIFERATSLEHPGYWTISETSLEVGRFLLAHGADPCVRDNNNITPFRAAFDMLDLPMCHEMLKTHRTQITESLEPADIRAMFLHITNMNDEEDFKGNEALDFILSLDTTGCICSDKDLFLGLFRTRSGDQFHVGLLGSKANFSFRTSVALC